MTLLKRTLLLVTSLLVVTVLVTAGVIAVSARQSILAQAAMDSRIITEEFARAVGLGREIGQELEVILAQQQSAEASLSSLLSQSSWKQARRPWSGKRKRLCRR